MGMKIKQGGVLRDIKRAKIKQGGVLRTIQRFKIKQGGVLRTITLQRMQWHITGGTSVFNSTRWAGWSGGYPWAVPPYGSINPSDIDSLVIFGEGELAGISTAFQPNVYQHYFVYFLNNWGTMTDLQNELNANWKIIIQNNDLSINYHRPFSSGVWGSHNSGNGTLWKDQPATENFEQMYLKNPYFIEIVRK